MTRPGPVLALAPGTPKGPSAGANTGPRPGRSSSYQYAADSALARASHIACDIDLRFFPGMAPHSDRLFQISKRGIRRKLSQESTGRPIKPVYPPHSP